MTDSTEECYGTAKSTLSPNVHYWWHGGLDRMTFPKEDGGIEMRSTGEIMEALARIG